MVTKEQCKEARKIWNMKSHTVSQLGNYISSLESANHFVSTQGIVGTSKQLIDSLTTDTEKIIVKAKRNLARAKLEERKAEEKLDTLWDQYELEHGVSPFAKTR